MSGYETQDNALRDRFNTEWADATPVQWPNVDFKAPEDANGNPQEYVRFVVEDIEAEQASMGDPGNNVYRHSGAVVLMIFTPAGAGDQRALELADRAAAIFRGWQTQNTGLRFKAPFVRRVGQEQKWYHINVLVPFQRDAHF